MSSRCVEICWKLNLSIPWNDLVDRQLHPVICCSQDHIHDHQGVQFKDKARQRAREQKLRVAKVQQQVKDIKGAEEACAQPKQPPAKPLRRPNAAKRRLLEQRQDEDELEEDYRLLKRLRRGKMTNVRLAHPHQFKREVQLWGSLNETLLAGESIAGDITFLHGE